MTTTSEDKFKELHDEVYKYVCPLCGRPNNHWQWECEACEAAGMRAEDE